MSGRPMGPPPGKRPASQGARATEPRSARGTPQSARGARPPSSARGAKKEVPQEGLAPSVSKLVQQQPPAPSAQGAEAELNVRVVARFRPMNEREKKANREGTKAVSFPADDSVEVDGSPQFANTANGEPLSFTFNSVLTPACTQEEVFSACCSSVLLDLFQGYHSTIFAYGQTGAGKSFTMMGDRSSVTLAGLIPRCTAAIFNAIQGREGVEFVISCSYLQVYMEVISDLLSPEKNNLQIRESATRGIYVEHLSSEYVASVGDVYELLDLGDANRKVGATNMNATSSRSHSCFIVNITQKDEEGATTHSRFNLVDLAGSERVGKTGAQGLTLEEAKKINLSLSCLSQCINALAMGGSQHVPFRSSKLTRLLQQSLGGNCKTTVVVACSPHESNLDETVSTLRFGERCSAVKCEAKANVMLSVEQLEEMVKQLQEQLQRAESAGADAQRKLRGDVQLTSLGTQYPEEDDEEGGEGGEGGEGASKGDGGQSLGVPVRRARKRSRAIPTGDARVAASVQLLNFEVEEFEDAQQQAFKEAVCDVLKTDIAQLQDGMDPSKVDVVDVQPGMQVAFCVHVPQFLAVEAATSLNISIGFGSNGSFVKALTERGFNLPNLSAPELVSNVTTQFSTLPKADKVSELDMLYTSVMEKQLEVEALKAEMDAMKTKLDSVKDVADRKQTHIDALSNRLTALNERMLQQENEEAAKANPPRKGSVQEKKTRKGSMWFAKSRPVSMKLASPFSRSLNSLTDQETPKKPTPLSAMSAMLPKRRSRAGSMQRRKASIPHFEAPGTAKGSLRQPSIQEGEEEEDEAKEDESKKEKQERPAPEKKPSLRLEIPAANEPQPIGNEGGGGERATELQEANQQLQDEVNELQGFVEDLEIQVDEQHDIIARQAQSIEKLEEERKEKDLDMGELMVEKEMLQKNISELEVEVARLQKQAHAARPAAHNIQKPIQAESVLREKRASEEEGGMLASLIPNFGGLFGSDSDSKEKGGFFGSLF